jgi:hypothetical protein
MSWHVVRESAYRFTEIGRVVYGLDPLDAVRFEVSKKTLNLGRIDQWGASWLR